MLFGSEITYHAAQFHVQLREEARAHHAHFVNEEPPPLERTLGDGLLRCGGLITFVTLCENWDAASVVDSVSTNELRHNSLESNHLELNAHLPMQLLLEEFAQELHDVLFACARSTMQ
jgi:hypothetical protein